MIIPLVVILVIVAAVVVVVMVVLYSCINITCRVIAPLYSILESYRGYGDDLLYLPTYLAVEELSASNSGAIESVEGAAASGDPIASPASN